MNRCCVILNEVKNLRSVGLCIRILRFAQDDTLFILGVALLFLCFPVSLHSQEPFRVMFWNVENLFDTKDDPRKNDNEFLPDAKRHWTPARYRDKLEKVAKGIIASGNEFVPDLVGLCEVENSSCLYDLTRHSPLREAGYRFVITDSPDQRGIDVALLYQPGSFKLITWQGIRIPHKQVKKGPTRDILHVVGKVPSGDTLDVFVCHMPSRSGGQEKSEPFRLLTADILKHATDSVRGVRQHPYVLVMGDFNDYPSNKSMKILSKGGALHNLMKGRRDGTYCYRGNWGVLDQFLVSETMLKRKAGIRTSARAVQILRHPFLLDNKGGKPLRTYNGLKYQGGYSDHLPISLEMMLVTTHDDTDYYSEW